jgi:hypothetical protein
MFSAATLRVLPSGAQIGLISRGVRWCARRLNYCGPSPRKILLLAIIRVTPRVLEILATR